MTPGLELKDNKLTIALDTAMAIELRRVMLRVDRAVDLKKNRCLMVTSAERGEGKSLFSLHFAHTLATHMPGKVLLVDGDLRRPVQHRVLEASRGPGLAELIQDPDSPPGVVETGIPGFDILPAGKPEVEISRLLASDTLPDAFLKLRQTYELIILDSPPVIYVSDPLQLARVSDGVMMLVMVGRTPQDVCKRGMGILRDAGVNVIGAVANNLAQVLPYYYDSRYYGYGKD